MWDAFSSFHLLVKFSKRGDGFKKIVNLAKWLTHCLDANEEKISFSGR